MKFGEKDNYQYGLKKKDVPYFQRIKQQKLYIFKEKKNNLKKMIF